MALYEITPQTPAPRRLGLLARYKLWRAAQRRRQELAGLARRLHEDVGLTATHLHSLGHRPVTRLPDSWYRPW